MNAGMVYFWLGHAVSAVAIAALVALIAPWLHRRLRLSHAARGYWLGAWALAVLPSPLAMALQWLVPASLASSVPLLGPMAEWSAVTLSPSPASSAAGPHALLAPALAAFYLVGLAIAALRWRAGSRAVRRLLQSAGVLDARQIPGSATRQQCEQLAAAGIRLLTVEPPVSPFATRWPRPTVVLPRALLDRLDDQQLRLVLRHEAAHLARHDPEWALLLRVVAALLWFNPFLRPLMQRVQLASELACDAQAIAADPNMRRAYAEAYLETLRMSMNRALPAPLIAFSPHDRGSHRMRIEHIVNGDPRARKRPWLAASLGLLVVVAGGGLAAAQAATLATGGVIEFTGPIINGRISSPFGAVRAAISARPHNGIDLTAARGTPVHAPAAGVVQVATANYAPQPDYGTLVIVDHGDGWQTVYAHLDSLDVAAGDRIERGQQIGRLGSTGKATGPHVHVEVHHRGQRVDPAAVIATAVAAP